MKKDTVMPTFRLPYETAQQYRAALEYYGVPRPIMARALVEAVIEAAKAHKRLKFPLRLDGC